MKQQIGNYRIERLLGQGGVGRVYQGMHTRLKRPVVIKVINVERRRDSKYIKSLKQEAQTLARLDHPNVVKVYDLDEIKLDEGKDDEASDLLYVVMGFVEGLDLSKVLHRPENREELIRRPGKVLYLIRQVCKALDYIHDRDLIHRDVKPSNIMIDSTKKVVLVDFGLAILSEFQQPIARIQGTPEYMAPEQLQKGGRVLPQSDLYAVGVILYEIFTGQKPFYADVVAKLAETHQDDPQEYRRLYIAEIARMVRTEDPRPPRAINPHLSRAIEEVILKAMKKRPADRYQSGAALADALQQAVDIPPPPPDISVGDVIIPSDLLTALNRGNVVLFCGAGITEIREGWSIRDELTAALMAGSSPGAIEDGPLPKIAQQYETLRGRHQLITMLEAQLAQHMPRRPLAAHQLIAKLPFKNIVTTNWDDLLEKALENAAVDTAVIVTDNHLRFEYGGSQTQVIKLYGSVNHRTSLIITDDDLTDLYGKKYSDRRHVYDEVHRLFNRYTLLFLGFDLADEGFKPLIKKFAHEVTSSWRRFYAIQENPSLSATQKRYWNRQGVVVIEANSVAFLQALQKKVKRKLKKGRGKNT